MESLQNVCTFRESLSCVYVVDSAYRKGNWLIVLEKATRVTIYSEQIKANHLCLIHFSSMFTLFRFVALNFIIGSLTLLS